jgi:hypothetical protein
MTTYFYDIRAALDARLNTLSGLPDTQWPNRLHTPTEGTLWIRPTVVPGGTRAATFDSDWHEGIYQIDIFAPIGKGAGVSDALRDSLADHFKPGTELISNSTTVRCIRVSQRVARTEGAWYHSIVEISYLAQTTNR